MPEKLFLLRNDDSLVPMTESVFQSEDVFQGLLEKFPELLTDAEFGEESPRRWTLVRREKGVADRQGGGDRWSLDHLFLDQDGIPTLVEIKRATDSRARREVVAQMLDYAANAVRWWKVDELVTWFGEACEARGKNAQEQLNELLQVDGADAVSFWGGVQSNLLSGRIRMIFVADKIAPELERIVEFLNEQMRPANVLALELRPFSSGSDGILSPRLIGSTSRAIAQKAVSVVPVASTITDWYASVFSGTKSSEEQVRRFIGMITDLGGAISIAGQSIAIDLPTERGSFRIAYVRPTGQAAVSGWMLRKSPGFETESSRAELYEAFATSGFHLSHSGPKGEPNFDLPRMAEEDRWQKLRTTFEAVFAKIRAALGGNQPSI
jgi:hypothetical protein